MYTVPPIGSSGPYATMQQVWQFLQKLKPNLQITDIPNYILNAATEIIENRTQSWNVFAGSIFVEGHAEAWVSSPITPINNLTGVNIYDIISGQVQSLRVGTPQGQPIPPATLPVEVQWEPLSGIVKRVNDVTMVIDINALDEEPTFAEGKNNVELIGNFGRGPYQILTPLTILICMQQMRFMYPADFRDVDLQREKIGDYSYDVNFMERTQDLKNQKKTLEGMIEWYFEQMPQDYGENYLAI